MNMNTADTDLGLEEKEENTEERRDQAKMKQKGNQRVMKQLKKLDKISQRPLVNSKD